MERLTADLDDRLGEQNLLQPTTSRKSRIADRGDGFGNLYSRDPPLVGKFRLLDLGRILGNPYMKPQLLEAMEYRLYPWLNALQNRDGYRPLKKLIRNDNHRELVAPFERLRTDGFQ